MSDLNGPNGLSGNPEQLINLITNFMSTPGVMQLVPDFEDNEIVTQILLTCFNSSVSNPALQQIVGSLNVLIESISLAISAMGYMMHVKQIRRSEMNNYIYYSRIAPDGQMLRSNYHPLHLMTFMEPREVPESFQKLFSDQDYLPNIVNIWDRGHQDSIMLISFQKLNLRRGTPPNPRSRGDDQGRTPSQ
jgi:hypothetical protein